MNLHYNFKMMNDISNLTSGMMGGIVVAIIVVIFSRFAMALRLNGGRIYLLFYLTDIARDKLERYIVDVHKAKREIAGEELLPEIKKEGYDMMPMLTSEIFKSVEPQEMSRIMYTRFNLGIAIQWYYGVDFLKNHMPIQLHKEYFDKFNSHLAIKNIKTKEEIEHHINVYKCATIQHFRKHYMMDLEAKEITAIECLFELDELTKNLKGMGWVWVLKYLFKF